MVARNHALPVNVEASVNNASTQVAEGRSVGTDDRAGALYAVFAAVLFGVVLIAGSGFAGSEALHNAAHDSRHSNAFPCH